MNLRDEEELETNQIKSKKLKRVIVVLIILLSILGMVLVGGILYLMSNPNKITTYIDGVAVQGFDTILDFETDENGNTKIYIPIREFASYLNAVNPEFEYQTFKGDYNPKTEEEDKCYVIREDYEVSLYSKKSKIIYKLNLQNRSEEYEECYIDKDIFEDNGQLYASVDGIEKGYNVSFSYNEQKKQIKIYTLDKLVQAQQKALENEVIANYGTLSIEDDNYTNCKAIFEDLLIVQSSKSNKYGIVKADDYTSFILEPQYDSISYVTGSSTFLVESNRKVGLFSKDGKRKINLIYDEIISMGQDSNLYMIKNNNMYGVVDGNGNIVIYPEYEQIGLDVSEYGYNGVKNGYILLNKLIPVLQDEKWGFFNIKGEKVTDGFIYNNIGCSSVRSVNNVYPLLLIQDYNVIVVQDEYDKFGFMDVSGNDAILQFLFDEMYIRTSAGESSYYMTYKEKEYEVLKYLKQVL